MRRLLFALLLAPLPGFGQELSPLSPNANSPMPACGPAMDGQAMCRFGRVYECEFVGPGSMERRTGWRWKSDLLRDCGPAPAPAELPGDRRAREPADLTYAPQTNGYGSQAGQSGMPAPSTSWRPRRHGLD
jgi:hypothetical protein